MTETFAAWQSSGRKPWQNNPRNTGFNSGGGAARFQPITPPVAATPVSSVPPIRRLTMAEKQERDAKGLCYKCDGKWSRGHRCDNVLLMFLNNEDEDGGTDDTPPEEIENIVGADISSLNSLAGTSTPRSLRLKGLIRGMVVEVLVDGGSSHNFIHPDVVKKLKLEVETVAAFKVYVGNGESLQCSQFCRSVPIELQQQTFGIDLYILPIHGPDVVLGVQWLSLLGRVTHDYAALTMDFTWEGRRIKLRGDPGTCRSITLNSLQGLCARGQVDDAFELFFLETGPTGNTTRAFDIPAETPTPVTVPDHFPIPTADELFDELGAARVFSKLDLRSGYHQIRMHGQDIYRTAFQTHDGHFEFLVMPFGLTNAPSTFQACMNKLFQPFLRKFIIVFFL